MFHHDHQKSDYILNLYIDEAFENIIAVATMYSSFKTPYVITTGF